MAATRGRCIAGLLAGIVALALPAPGQGQDGAPQPVAPQPVAAAPPAEPAPLPATPTVPAPPAREIAPAADLLPGGVHVGIADQKFDMFGDERFAELGIRHARLAIAWDAMRYDWQVEQLDAWLAGAKALGIQPLISFGHSRTNRRSVPTPTRMRLELRKLRRRYPWVKTYATWNEANHCGEPLCHRARLAASYYRALRRECPSCKILAPEILDTPNAVAWVREFRRALGYTPKVWGVHNYLEANRFRMSRLRALLRAMPGASVWLTETGGLVRRDNASTTDIPEGPRHAAEVTRYLFDRVLPLNPRVKAVYLYHWNAGPVETTWDSGLITPAGRERTSLSVLRRVLHSGPRPRALPLSRLTMLIDCALYKDGCRQNDDPLPVAEAAERRLDDGGFVWLGLHDPEPEELMEVARRFDLPPLAVEDAMQRHQRPKLEDYDDGFFLVLHTARYLDDSEEVEFGEVHVFTGPGHVVVVRHGAASELRAARERLEHKPELVRLGTAAAVWAVMDKVVDDYQPVVEGLENDVEEVEQVVFEGAGDQTRRIYFLRRELADFYRAVHPLLLALDKLESRTRGDVPKLLRNHLRDVEDHVMRIEEEITAQRDVLGSIFQANLAVISLQQNDIVKRISGWAAIIAVPTLLGSVWGMNFKHMPELTWRYGYPLALTVMVVAGLALFRILRRASWI